MPHRLRTVEAVLFDLDGTLHRAEALSIESARRGFARSREEGWGFPTPPESRILDQLGRTMAETEMRMVPDAPPELQKRIIQYCWEAELALLDEGYAEPFPGTVEVLDTLRGRGFRLGLVSNCLRDYFDRVPTAIGVWDRFDVAFCAGDRPGWGKRELIAEALRTLGTSRAVMVGDRASDVEGASASGIPAIGCAYGYGSDGELAGTVATIARIDELPGLLPARPGGTA